MASNPTKKLGTDFLCSVKYENVLPPEQFPPKLLPVINADIQKNAGISESQAEKIKYSKYRHNTLEESLPYPLYVDEDLGMPLDLCLLGVFDNLGIDGEKNKEPELLDEEDMFLLGENYVNNNKYMANGGINKSTHVQGVLGGGLYGQINTGKQMGQYTVTTGARSGILGGLKKGSSMYSGTGMSPDIGGKSLLEGLRGDGIRNMKRKAEEFDDSVEGQRQFITKTLKKSEKIMLDHDVEKNVLDSLVHPTDKSAKAMKMIPVFPDFFMWQNDYSLFTFDDLPMPPFISENEKNVVDLEENKTLSDQAYNTTLLRAREKARGYFDKGKQVWLEYFLPESRDTAAVVAEKRELGSVDSPRDESDTQVEGDLIYKLAREYEFATAPDALRQDNLLLSIRRNERTNEPEAFYMPIKSRFIMKRRNQASTNYLQEDVEDDTSVSHISLSFRAPNADELSASQSALSQLYND